MKHRVGLLFTALLCILLCLGAAAETLTWADTAETPNLSASGYPRFAKRADGTLLLTADNGYIYHSTDNGKSWTRQTAKATAAAATSKTTASGVTHTLTCANLQPYVLPDGKVLLSYRCHTRSYASGEFYTSIRVMTSTDGGVTFGNEKILVEATSPSSAHGFWEPFFQRIAPDKIALYYADDLCVNLIPSQQRIAYLTYTISTGAWSTEPAVAIYRPDMKSRDGMPTTTALSDGGFAMVVEAHDYTKTNSSYNCPFVIGLSLSADGLTWSDPIPVAAPTSLTAGQRCSAPSIATLPDGRVIIVYMTDEYYTGSNGTGDRCRVLGGVVSDAPLRADSELTATTGGAAPGFTRLGSLFTNPENAYMQWNTVSVFGNDVYVAGTAGTNTASGGVTGSAIRIRRAYAADTGFAPGSGAVVFVDNAKSDTNDGLTAQTAFKTLGKAIATVKETGGTIVISGKVAVGSPWVPAANSGAIVFTSIHDGVDYRLTNGAQMNIGANMAFQGDVYFENIRFNITKSTLYFSGRFHNLGFGDGMQVQNGTGSDTFSYPTLVGGWYAPSTLAAASTENNYSITVKSGTWQSVSGGNFRSSASQPIGNVAGDVAVEITGGTFLSHVYGTGMNVHSGRVSLSVSGGRFHTTVIPFKRYGTMPTDTALRTAARADGNMLVRITGGDFINTATDFRLSESNVATLHDSYPIYSTATVVITGGSFAGKVCGYSIVGTTLLKYSLSVLPTEQVEGFPNFRTQTLTRSASPLENSAFRLPMLQKADPYVIEKDDVYYYCFSSSTTVDGVSYPAVKVAASGSVSLGSADAVSNSLRTVFNASMTDIANAKKEYWAPELHYFSASEVGASAAGWYIYVAADDGKNDPNHRMYVLRANDPEDALSDYTMVGKITSADDHWAIDGTVLHLGGKIYFVWSGWEGSTNVSQKIYIAQMSSPTKISSSRVCLSSPTYAWETHGTPTVNEGPQILQKDGTTHIVYSASGSWTQYYCYGILTLTGTNPLSAASWTKNASAVFSSSSANSVYGPGHGTFVQDANGEWWMIYHANNSLTVPDGSSWWAQRHVHAKKFTWTTKAINGTNYAWPSFGTPTAAQQFEIVKTADYHDSGDHVFGAVYARGGSGVCERWQTCVDCGQTVSLGVSYAEMPSLTVTSENSSSATLSWTKVDGATGYRVSRKAPGETSYSFYRAVTGEDTCRFTDTGLTSAARYCYSVCAYFTDRAGNSANCSAASGGKEVYVLPKTPVATVEAYEDGGLRIKVSTTVDCTGYIYYRSTDNKTYTKLAATTAASYVDTAGTVGTTYYYKVAAYSGSETWCGTASAAVSKAATPASPRILSYGYDGSAVTIRWSAVEGVSRYKVFRRTDGDSTWTSWYVAVENTAYTDKTAVAGTKYIYAVQSDQLVGSTRYYSPLSPVQKAVYAVAPSFTGSTTSSSATLTWDAVDGAERYILARKAPGATAFTDYKTLAATETSFTDSALGFGTYSYQLRADYQSTLGAAVTAPVECTVTVAPKTPAVKATAVCNAVDLTVSTASDGAGYIFYRSTDNKNFTRLASQTGTTYTDSTVVAGTTYYYRVTGYSGTTESAASATVSVKAVTHGYTVTAAAVAPTCTTSGKTAVETCSRCGVTRGGETVAKLAHTVVTDKAVAATCTTAGKTEGSHCSVCNTVLVAQKTVAALGHDYAVTAQAIAPTYETEGKTAVETCSRCGVTRGGETIPKLEVTEPIFTPIESGDAYDALASRAGEKHFAAADITLPNAETSADVAMALPEGFAGERAYVYRLDGEFMTLVNATLDGAGNAVFTVYGTGRYAVADAPLVLYGDADADGRLSLRDIICILRYTAERDGRIDKAASDIYSDLSITVTDALAALKALLK